MQKMQKMTKNRKTQGFTLVEVIVVAVIVLILSAAAIPIYNGFVKQARRDAVLNLAETGAAAANSYWRKTNSGPTHIDSLKLYYDRNKHIVGFGSAANVGASDPVTASGSHKLVCAKDIKNAIDTCLAFRN